MRRPDRGTLRAAGFTALLAVVFLTVNTSVAQAADGTVDTGGLLSPLELDTSEGASLKGYELGAQGGSVFALASNTQAMVLSGLFTAVRVLVGLACWAIEVAYRFPLLKLLAAPAQHLSEVYTDTVVDDLGLKAMLLAWAFVFGLVLLVRGKHARGLGEIALTLIIGALAASVFVTPNFLLGKDGPILQTQSAAGEIAQKTVGAHDWGSKISNADPCDDVAGPAKNTCRTTQPGPTGARKVARPIQDAVTNALVVKPYMLLQYGRILDPGKASDRKAYQVHLKWVSGGYGEKAKKKDEDKDDPCRLIKGEGRKWCEREPGDKGPDTLPELTPGGKLLEEVAPVLSKDDQQFAQFLKDLKAAGPVGKEAAAYAEQPSWWRVAAVVMVFIAALLICALLLSAAVVLLGISAVCAGAAATGGVTFVWGMLPGPSRSVVWKWLGLFGIAMAAILAIATFIPAVGITIDVILTDGPDLMAERLLLIDVLALVGLAFHRLLLVMVVSFSQRLTLRMRYAKIGGSHMAGDSQLGAALAMSIGSGAQGGLLTGSSLRGRGATGLGYGTGGLLRGSLAGLTDGTGMPGDASRLLADANAEASRGLAPIGLAVAGTRLAAGAAWAGLVGKNPGEDKLAALRKPTADGDADESAPGTYARMQSVRSTANGPKDRYRDEDGKIVDPASGAVLHDQNTDRTLLSTRAHNQLVRLRGYRVAHQGGRLLYGATLGLPATARTTRTSSSQATAEARQQLRVWGSTVRRDGQAWASMLQQPAADRPQATGRRLTTPAPAGRTATAPAAAPGSPVPRSASAPSYRPDRGGVAAPTWADMTTASGPAAPGPRPRPAPSSTRTPTPEASTRRVQRPRPRPGLGATNESRRRAESMFRRIQDNNATNPPARPEGDSTDGDGGDLA